jgi:macrodomain Ter protein organizer (MatP/YcbG family)
MSGGHFQYKQWEIGNIADEVEQLILDNDSEEVNEWGDRKGCHFSPETIAEFKQGLTILRQAHIYAQRIDWLVSGDDGEDSFHRRLKHDLEKLND